MYRDFLEFFKKSVQYNIYGNDYRTFIIAFGGMQFGKGMFTVFDKGDALDWERKIAKTFPEYKGMFRAFGCDWMGRCFAVPAKNEEKIIMFDPGVLEVYEVPLNLRDFVNRAIPLNTNECLAADSFISWYRAYGEELGKNRCVGYKVPLFLGGVEEAENFELQEMDVYWDMVTKAAMKLRGIPEETEQEPAVEGEQEGALEDVLEEEGEDEVPIEELSDEEIEQLEENAYFAQQAEEAEDFFILQQKRVPYIKKNVDKYLEKFKKMHMNGTRMSWNWCGFLFGCAWFLYRKLYKCFILTLLIAALVSGLVGGGLGFGLAMAGFGMDEIVLFATIAGIVITLAIMVILGIFSDHWLRKKIDKLVTAGENAETEEEREKTLKKGGVNIPLLIVYIVISVISTVPWMLFSYM